MEAGAALVAAEEAAAAAGTDAASAAAEAAGAPAPLLRERAAARRAEASLLIPADREGLFSFEAFADSLAFLEPLERARLKLAGGEIIDNLIRHAAPLASGRVAVRAARRGGRPYLLFFFKSPTFASYAARCADHEPVYDRGARRWHGMGLRMCRNLSSALSLRSGALCDRIFLRF